MTAIGAVTDYPEFKFRKCEQCGKWFFYARKTRKTCSDACRKAASRGDVPTDKNPHMLFGHEQFAAAIAANNPRAFKSLEKLKAKYGHKALEMCLDVLMEFAN